MLKGIALCVSGDFGQSIVVQYPPSNKSQQQLQKQQPLHTVRNSLQSPINDEQRSSQPPASLLSPHTHQQQQHQPPNNTYNYDPNDSNPYMEYVHGIPADLFSTLFTKSALTAIQPIATQSTHTATTASPENELSDALPTAVQHLSINNLRFLYLPIQLPTNYDDSSGDEDSHEPHSTTSSSHSERIDEQQHHNDAADDATSLHMFNVVYILDNDAVDEYDLTQCGDDEMQQWCQSVPTDELQSDHPLRPLQLTNEQPTGLASDSTKQPKSTISILECFESIAVKVSRALEHEQLRCGFVAQQSAAILTLKEQMIQDFELKALDSPLDAPQSSTPTSKPTTFDFNSVTDTLCQQTILARHVRDLFDGLKRQEQRLFQRESLSNRAKDSTATSSVLHLIINNWIHVYCTLCDHSLDQKSNGQAATDSILQPYQTLLLYESNEAVLTTLSADSSPLLRAFIQTVQPTLSFQAISEQLQLPLNTIYRLALHLQYWRQGKIIDHIHRHSVFVVNTTSHAYVDTLSADLLQQLTAFSVQQPLEQHLASKTPAQQQLFLTQLVQLLRSDCVTEVHEHLLYLPTASAATTHHHGWSLDQLRLSPGIGALHPAMFPAVSKGSDLLLPQPHADSRSTSPLTLSPATAALPVAMSHPAAVKHGQATSTKLSTTVDDQKLLQQLAAYLTGETRVVHLLHTNEAQSCRLARKRLKQLQQRYPAQLLSLWC